MNRKQLRKDVYDIVWATLTQQLKTHICIEEDPEDDKLDDIELNIDIAKYCGTFSWILSREDKNYKFMHMTTEMSALLSKNRFIVQS